MEKKLTIETRQGTYLLNFDHISYLENDKRKVIVHAADGCYVFYGRLADVMGQLDERFLLCHRSYAINMERVQTMENKSISFIDGSMIFLGRDTYYKTKRQVLDYMRENAGRNRRKPLKNQIFS